MHRRQSPALRDRADTIIPLKERDVREQVKWSFSVIGQASACESYSGTDGPDRRLVAAVTRLVGVLHFESDWLITSFHHGALLDVKRHDPRLQMGLIVAYTLGDISRLELEALRVRAESLSDELIQAAHRAGRKLHVWTVSFARQMDRMIKRGVDNIITDAPDMLIQEREALAKKTRPEWLLLTARLPVRLDR